MSNIIQSSRLCAHCEDTLVLHYYPAIGGEERNPAHKDFGFLTLLIQDSIDSSNGL